MVHATGSYHICLKSFCCSFSSRALEARGLAISILDSFVNFSVILGHFAAHFIVDRQ